MASRWPADNQSALIQFYGDPASEVAPQLVKVVPPFKMNYAGTPVPHLLFHKKAAPALTAALNKVWDYYGRDQKKIDALGISKTAGTYNKRFIRGSSTKWSNHAYGAAIDINAEENGFNMEGNIPIPMIAAFKSEGARWGGDYRGRKDPMHFEFCNSGEPTRTFEEWLAFYKVKPGGDIPKSEEAFPHRYMNVIATVFGGADDPNQSAYGGMVDPNKPGVALPYRFKGARPKVRVFKGNQSVVCEIVDVGPWNIDDPYWSEPNRRPQAETGRDMGWSSNGVRKTNLAGIDLTLAAARAIGLNGKGLVDWEFVGSYEKVPTAKKPATSLRKTTESGAAGVAALSLFTWLGTHPLVAVIAAGAIAVLALVIINLLRRNK